MAYWIHENGETIGPLRAIDVFGRAQLETLVSHGQQWLPLRDHPDFSTLISAASSMNPNPLPKSDDRGSELEVPLREKADPSEVDSSNPQYWVLWPFSFSAKGPYSHEKVARELPVKILVRCGEKWIPKDRHPDFSEHTKNEENPARVPPDSADGRNLLSRIPGIDTTTGLVAFVSLMFLLVFVVIAEVGTLISNHVETAPQRALAKAIRKADADWNADRYEDAVARYEELIKDLDSTPSGTDVHQMLSRVLEFHLTTSDTAKISEYVTLSMKRKMTPLFSDPQIKKTFEDARQEILAKREAEARKPATVKVSCKYDLDLSVMTTHVANRVWNAVQQEPTKSTIEVKIVVYGNNQYGEYVEKSCSILLDANEIRRYRQADYFVSNSSSQDLMKIWIALKNI